MGKKTYIYSLAHPITEEIRYVGKTNNLIQRLQVHLRDKAKTHKTNWIKSLLLNKMIPLIDVIDEVPVSEWGFWEKHYISLYKSWGFNLTNMADGGVGGDTGAEANEKRKKSLNGHFVSQQTRDKIGSKNLGTKRTQDVVDKMSASHKTAFLEGRKNHLKNFNKGTSNPRAFKVVQKNIDGTVVKIWDYAKLAIKELGLSYTAITRCLHNHQKTAGGFMWERAISENGSTKYIPLS